MQLEYHFVHKTSVYDSANMTVLRKKAPTHYQVFVSLVEKGGRGTWMIAQKASHWLSGAPGPLCGID